MHSQTTPTSPPAFSRFSRMGFGLVSKLQSRPHDTKKTTADDDEWYIPYNGPYEEPKELPRRRKVRDSWGDLVDEGEDEDAMLDDKELHKRYGGHKDFANWPSSAKFSDEERKGRSRDRTFSMMSGRTVSSGAVDPGRASIGTQRRLTVSSGAVDPNRTSLAIQRRSTVSSGNRPPVPSYINLDAMGGVGESPMPQIDAVKDHDHTFGRISLASIFSFGSSGGKSPISPTSTAERVQQKVITWKAPHSSKPKQIKVEGKWNEKLDSPHLRRSTSSESQRVSLEKSTPRHVAEVVMPAKVNNEAEYYNLYYETLLKTPAQETVSQPQYHEPHSGQPGHPYSSNSPSSQGESTSSSHPYAYTFPKQPHMPESPPSPVSYPIIHHDSQALSSQQRYAEPPRLTFAPIVQEHANSHVLPFPLHRATDLGFKQLKNSASSPNLRTDDSLQYKADPMRAYTPPRGLDRWLSAETWCDALLFPRPRLKLKEDQVSSGRIVSPPGTPLMEGFAVQSSTPGVVSRVLAHSRSLVDLNGKQSSTSREQVIASTSKAAALQSQASMARPSRPKSFAQDDLALLGPIFSLEKVLEEGEELEHERKQWQIQAASSLGNKRARSLSRTRSKSLTQNGRRGGREHQNTMGYLAARACLGNQDLPLPQTSSFSDAPGTITTASGRASHSHSHSLAKSLSKSSKTTHSHSHSLAKSLSKSSKTTHSRDHSRSESWAMKVAKSTAAIRGHPVDNQGLIQDMNDKASSLEGALRRDDTRIIRFPDPAQIPVDKGLPHLAGNAPRVSPTPSGVSDVRLGIALSTPPLLDDSLYREPIRIPAHPYAQGGLSTANTTDTEIHQGRGSDYAGPHPSAVVAGKLPDVSSVLARHKLPPQITAHPYAQASATQGSDDRLIAHMRSESNIPPPAKMWAQLSPGVIREILPGDLKYSPFLPDHDIASTSDSPDFISDSVGLGEVLAYVSFRDSRDSGLGTSEGHVVQPYGRSSPQNRGFEVDLPEFGSYQVHRQAVQYDATRPVYFQHLHAPHDSPTNNAAPVQLPTNELLPIPEVDHPPSHSPAATSETSSPHHSPRILGSPNDLENFHDLFYKPRASVFEPDQHEDAQKELSVSSSPPPIFGSLSWEVANRSRRTGSGLTSLARQLSEEFEQMAIERDRSSSQCSYSTGSFKARNSHSRRPTERSLEFVFEEAHRSSSPISEEFRSEGPPHAFKPSFNLPEDIELSRTSSPVEREEDEDDTAMLRHGVIESVSTPPVVSADRRHSLTAYTERLPQAEHTTQEPHLSVISGLQPPTDATRSSYMTTSTASRMSGLSDFPIPPKDDHFPPAHMSLLTSYFDETLSQRELQAMRDTPHPFTPHEGRLTFSIESIRSEEPS